MKKTWKYKIREPRIEGEVAYIPLTRGLEATIDTLDLPLVQGWNWCAFPAPGGRWYAYSAGNRKLRLHQHLLPLPRELMVDHIDGNGLNCRRANLRAATPRQNRQNSPKRRDSRSPYKGVSLRGAMWRARIGTEGGRISLGNFASPEEAACAYDRAALKYFGEFAALNFSPD